jgi:EAL domain-containing protein (putative c-di-GMP-specific phosphodiesterase class I)
MAGIDYRRLTEEQIVTDPALAIGLAEELHHLDVRLAVHEFGCGYSSLARLKELPFAELKLDRAFVTDCAPTRSMLPTEDRHRLRTQFRQCCRGDRH